MHKMPPLAAVSSRFGAPMGRRDTHADYREKPRLFLLARLAWVDGDYDAGGAYWGYAEREHIYRAVSEDGAVELFVRARHIDEAKYCVLEEYNATFAFGGDIETFIEAYIECALWSSTDADGDPLDNYASPEDIAPETLAKMREDCVDFYAANEQALEDWADDSQAGHDFWLTRNRHGAGFWDRGRGALGQRLTDAAHVYGSVDLYVGDDHLIYC
ncbi:hypothetical protein [Cupriavidus basilensis]|uniref:hypothetical protein n=1 Tax=Cupriavidus basilensis TaxID=68895 RepID=UPI0020A6BFD0|nr:hypothetical protein [Cupriavidus basilensis]MCP3017426.1 hypothetical protein [Cupriavidus basilensis]